MSKRGFEQIRQAPNFSIGLSRPEQSEKFSFGINFNKLDGANKYNFRNRKIAFNIINLTGINTIENIQIGEILFGVKNPYSDLSFVGKKQGFAGVVAILNIFFFNRAEKEYKDTKKDAELIKFNKNETFGLNFNRILSDNAVNKFGFTNYGDRNGNSIFDWRNFEGQLKRNDETFEKEYSKYTTMGEGDEKVKLLAWETDRKNFGTFQEKTKWMKSHKNFGIYTNIDSVLENVYCLGVAYAPKNKNDDDYNNDENRVLKKKKLIADFAIYNEGTYDCFVPSENEIFKGGIIILDFEEVTYFEDIDKPTGPQFKYIKAFIKCVAPNKIENTHYFDKNGEFKTRHPIVIGTVLEKLNKNKYDQNSMDSSMFNNTSKILLDYRKNFAVNCKLELNSFYE